MHASDLACCNWKKNSKTEPRVSSFQVNIPRKKEVFPLHKFLSCLWHLGPNVFQLLLVNGKKKINTVLSPINPT